MPTCPPLAVNAQRLAQTAYEALFFPLRDAFVEAQRRGEVRDINPEMLAGFYLALMDGITFSQTQPVSVGRAEMAEAAIDMVLHGIMTGRHTASSRTLYRVRLAAPSAQGQPCDTVS